MICREELCTGCAACQTACPVTCITMRASETGFMLPHIDQDRCIHCKRCEEVCPAGKVPIKANTDAVWAMRNCNAKERHCSSSGGIFSPLARYVLRSGGVVYGAQQFSALDVRHVRVASLQELPALRGSKYIQSNIGMSYRLVQEDLEYGRKVMFVGTPCQVVGLKAFLNREWESLLTVDLVCHGVISPLAVRTYLNKENFPSENTFINWRDKSGGKGWHGFSLTLTANYSTRQRIFARTTLGEFFINNLFLRPSCYTCQNKANHSLADITLGDYWGIENSHPELDDNAGTSVVIAHTQKACGALEAIRGETEAVSSTFEQAAKENWALYSRAETEVDWTEAFALLKSDGLDAVWKKYLRKPLWRRAGSKIKRTLCKMLRDS